MWDPPGPGHEPVSPALAGGFPTAAPPGKPSVPLFMELHLDPIWQGAFKTATTFATSKGSEIGVGKEEN